jgi:hypothetical protein
MAKEKPYSPWARLLGDGLARVQHGVDGLVRWGFRRLESVDRDHHVIEVDESHPYVTKAKKVAKGTLGFLGEAGIAYYKAYEKLKKEKGR